MAKDIPPTLNNEDSEAWTAYARMVKPMRKSQKTPEPQFTLEVNFEVPPPPKITRQEHIVKPPSARDLKNIQINARLDLHGLTLEKAHERILHFITNSYHVGHRCVLIITGKGLSQTSEWWQEQGILRQQVPRWLDESPLRTKITTHTLARPEHGGTGAIYVFLKRKRAV